MTDKKFQRKLDKMKKQGERYKQEYEVREAYAQYVPDKKTRKVSNIMLVIIIIAIIGYFVANLYLQCQMGIEISSTLTTCWFSFWGIEVVSLAAIKRSKVKHEAEEIQPECTYDDISCDESGCE